MHLQRFQLKGRLIFEIGMGYCINAAFVSSTIFLFFRLDTVYVLVMAGCEMLCNPSPFQQRPHQMKSVEIQAELPQYEPKTAIVEMSGMVKYFQLRIPSRQMKSKRHYRWKNTNFLVSDFQVKAKRKIFYGLFAIGFTWN